MKKIIFVILFLYLPLAHAQGQTIVAVVNESPITDFDLTRRMDLIIKSNNLATDAKSIAALRPQVIQMLVDEKLFEQEAKKINISVDQEDINRSFAGIAEDLKLKPNQLRGFLQKNGISPEELENQVRHQMLGAKLVKIEIEPFIRVTDQDIRDYHTSEVAHSENQDKIKVAEIVLFPNPDKVEEARKLMAALVKQLKEGANFASLAKNFSQSLSAEDGGEIGWLYINQLSEEFVSAIKSLKPGDISEPIVIDDSIYVLKILDKKREKQIPELPPEIEMQDHDLRQSLKQKKMDIQVKSYILNLRNNAFIDVK